MADIVGGLKLQVHQALSTTSGAMGSAQAGLGALGRMLERLTDRLHHAGLDPQQLLTDTDNPSPAWASLAPLLVTLSRKPSIDADGLRQLDRQLAESRRELETLYEAHQLRQAQLVTGHLDEEDIAHWLETLETPGGATLEAGTHPEDYPVEEMELALRFRGAVWHLVAGLRASFKGDEHEGWILFELALLLPDELSRRHRQEAIWATQEIERAALEQNPDDGRMWQEHRGSHEERFRRWWQLFGPLHAWLTERLELCPDGLDKVFYAIGEDVWELPMPELLDRARDLLV